MLTIFFALIFIAELVLSVWVISAILKLDKLVCQTNEKITQSKTPIEKSLLKLSIFVNKASLAVTNIRLKIEEQKKNYTLSIIKSIVIGILFLALDKNGKQALSTADTIISGINFINKITKMLV